LQRVEGEGGDPRTKVQRAGALTFSKDLLAIDLAVRDWSRRDPAIAERLRRVDERRMEYLRSVIGSLRPNADDVEARCLLAFSLAISNDLINTGHGALERAQVIELALTRILAR
jgi:hypothetical protein